jgi:hypothetical protein
MFKLIRLFLILILLSSCSPASMVEPVPLEYRKPSLRYYVENHGKDKLHLETIIANEIQKHGINVSTGSSPNARPINIDILVLYEDRWSWDMSNYLAYMRIDLRSPKTNVLLATGSSDQVAVSIMARKSEEEIIKNIISEMFK